MIYKYLTMLNTLLLRLSPHLQHSTSLPLSTLHFLSFTLHYPLILLNPFEFPTAPLHLTSFHLTSLHFTSLHFTSLHFTSLHFTSLHFTPFSPHFYSFHFKTFIIASLTLFLKILVLQRNSLTRLQVVGSSFYGPITKEYSWYPFFASFQAFCAV
jgi:hypothetical protein